MNCIKNDQLITTYSLRTTTRPTQTPTSLHTTKTNPTLPPLRHLIYLHTLLISLFIKVQIPPHKPTNASLICLPTYLPPPKQTHVHLLTSFQTCHSMHGEVRAHYFINFNSPTNTRSPPFPSPEQTPKVNPYDPKNLKKQK